MSDLQSGLVKFLKKQAHSMRPVVIIGKHGSQDSVMSKVDTELTVHELIKVRILDDESAPIRDTANTLATSCRAILVQCIGKTIVLFRLNHKLPADTPIKACGLVLDRSVVRRLMFTTPKQRRSNVDG